MRTIGHAVTSLFVAVMMSGALFTVPATGQAADTRDLILAAYSVPKEAYERHIIPAFQKHWKQKTGQDVRVRSSYGASGAQARAIIGGFDADVAVLSLEGDVDQVVKAGLITHDWRKAPHGGMISASVVALGVRKGNPKGVKGWEDAARPGIEVLYPNPKTSGGAMWDVIAIYGAGIKLAEQAGKQVAPEAAATQAVDLLTRIQRNVKVMDKSGRESVTTFERGVGDVIVTYENELLPRVKSGRPYEIIVPAETVWIENPAAVVDTYADRHKAKDLAEAFVAFLHGPEAQAAFIELGFRPLDRTAAAPASAATLPQPAHLFTVADLGGWESISNKLFGAQGVWTKIVEDVSKR